MRHAIHVDLPGGGHAIVHTSKPVTIKNCYVCGKITTAPRSCDYPVTSGRTCDRTLCEGCSTKGGKDIDYCPPHAELKGIAG